MKNKTILGIDPGYGIVGFGLVNVSQNKLSHINHGVIKTNSKSDFADRLEIIADDLDFILKKYKPNFACVEKIFFAKNQKTAIDVGQARGVILLTLKKNKVPILELTPLQIKQGLTSYGKAEKGQMQRMVKTILKLNSTPKPDDAADALAAAIVALNYYDKI